MSSSSLLFAVLYFSALCWRLEASDLGGQVEIKDLDDPFVKNVASFAVHSLNKETQGDDLRVLVKVVGGTSQVVAGVRYKLIIEVGLSTQCSKEAEQYADQCNVDKDTVKKWYADVWVKPTNPPEYVLNELKLYTS